MLWGCSVVISELPGMCAEQWLFQSRPRGLDRPSSWLHVPHYPLINAFTTSNWLRNAFTLMSYLQWTVSFLILWQGFNLGGTHLSSTLPHGFRGSSHVHTTRPDLPALSWTKQHHIGTWWTQLSWPLPWTWGELDCRCWQRPFAFTWKQSRSLTWEDKCRGFWRTGSQPLACITVTWKTC